MKVALVAPSPVPFTIGGAEKLWWGMLEYINQQTRHQAELIKLPSPERNFPELIRSYEAFSKLDLSHFDRIITTKYPAWMVDHPEHFCYLQHKLRGLYDTYHFCHHPEALDSDSYPASYRPLLKLVQATPDRRQLDELFQRLKELENDGDHDRFLHFPGPLTRAVIHHLDAIAQRPGAIKHYGAISYNVSQRRDYFPQGAQVHVVHHPSDLKGIREGAYDYLFTVSRLDAPKRIDLLIRAFLEIPDDIELRIAGTGPREDELKALAAGDPRIKFLGRITDTEIAEQYADALFVPFLPYDEDYGLITIEAMAAGKAVLTTTDAGGVNEFVENGITGFSVEPDKRALTDGIKKLLNDPEATKSMGQTAKHRVAGISWASTLAPLLQEGNSQTACPERKDNGSRRKKIVVTSTFPAWPPQGGGQSRLYNLYSQLARDFDITLVCLGSETRTLRLRPGLVERVIPLSPAQKAHAKRLQGDKSASIGDIAAIDGILKNRPYLIALAEACEDADLVIASHPYLYKAMRAVWQGPIAYDAHNVEADMKAAVLKGESGADELVALVRDNEARCIADSQWIAACSERDIARFEALYGSLPCPAVVVGNGIDLSTTPYIGREQRRRLRSRLGIREEQEILVFMGSWHGPNIEAGLHLLTLARSRPDWQFWLFGSLCNHPEFKSLPGNVHSLGLLSEKEKQVVMSASSIALNPMSSGSGTNLKMLEYAASGVDIITTPFGNRGLDFIEETEVGVAPIDRFEAGIERLLALSDEQRAERTRRARHRVEQQFDWAACAAPLSTLIQSADQDS